MKWMLKIHTLEYLRRAEAACREGERHLDSLDVAVSSNSFEIAKLSCGGALQMVDEVMSGRVHNGFCLLRPPGHHAENSQAMGFCLVNNIAVAARYAQVRHGVEKILILDWDVHHGNGTQHSFEEDPSILYVSLHQYPYYPGTGAAHETGRGKGKGATLNCPMIAGSTDAHYHDAFTRKILPKLQEFKPQLVLLSAGFDAHTDDPLASIDLSEGCFGWMTERVMEVADRFSGGKIVSLLEGGYDLRALSLCVENHLEILSGTDQITPKRAP